MALYPCPECKHEISTDAKTCPHCGKDVRFIGAGQRWKVLPKSGKIFVILAVLIIAFAVWVERLPKSKDIAPAPKADVVPSVGEVAPKPTSGVLVLAGKTEAESAIGLGQPVKREATKYGPKVTYHLESGAKITIIYIGGKADWITMTPRPGKNVPFSPEAIAGIVLEPSPPTFRSAETIRWENKQGLREVSIHAGPGGTVGYFYIKVRTD